MTKKKEAKEAADKPAKDKIDVEAATLVGNVRDDILSVFKTHADWKKIPEGKQREVAQVTENIAKDVVRRASGIIAARGFKKVNATLDKIVIKDGIQLQLSASHHDQNKDELFNSQGGAVTIVLSDIAPYMQNRSEPEIDEDEPTLPGVGKKKK